MIYYSLGTSLDLQLALADMKTGPTRPRTRLVRPGLHCCPSIRRLCHLQSMLGILLLYSTTARCTALSCCSTVQYSNRQYSMVNTVQHSQVQFSTLRYSTMNTVQYITVQRLYSWRQPQTVHLPRSPPNVIAGAKAAKNMNTSDVRH